MMRSNSFEKKIAFSNLQIQQVVEGIIKDNAAALSKTESAIIEKALIAAFLPANKFALLWAQSLYIGGALSEAYTFAFCHLAAGIDWYAAADNGRPLVLAFESTLSMAWPTLSGVERELYHLHTQLDSICAVLPDSGTASNGDKDLCRICLRQLQECPAEFYLIDVVGLILRSWDILGNYTCTYRALADIARLAAPVLTDTPNTRVEYLAALRTVSDGWQRAE